MTQLVTWICDWCKLITHEETKGMSLGKNHRYLEWDICPDCEKKIRLHLRSKDNTYRKDL